MNRKEEDIKRAKSEIEKYNKQIEILSKKKFKSELFLRCLEVEKENSKIFTFASAQGGSGKTTTVINTAIHLAKLTKKKVCILDFDFTNASFNYHLMVSGFHYTIDNLIDIGVEEIDRILLSKVMASYSVFDKDGAEIKMDILFGDTSSHRYNEIPMDLAEKILDLLKEQYDYILIDTDASTFSSMNYNLLGNIIYVLIPNAISASFLTRCENKNINFVISKSDSDRNEIKLEKITGTTPVSTIPLDLKTVRDSINQSIPIALRKHGKLNKAYKKLASFIVNNK